MPSKNAYSGYVKLPGKELYREEIRLDFNAQTIATSGDARLRSFNLRMFTLPSDHEVGKGLHPEIAVSLTSEQWLDLIEAMKLEIESAEEVRRKFDC